MAGIDGAVEVPVFAEFYGRRVQVATWLLDTAVAREFETDPAKFTVSIAERIDYTRRAGMVAAMSAPYRKER